MIKIYRKKVAWMLMAGLLLGSLSGCQKKETGSIKGTAVQERESRPGRDTTMSAQEPEESKAMGRYSETEIELPEEIENHMKCGFFRGESGNLELYTKEGDYYSEAISDTFRYIYQDGVWERDEAWAGNDALKEKGIDLMYITWGMDKAYYLI